MAVVVTRWVVLVGLLEGIHGDFSSGGQERNAAAEYGVNSEVVVVVKAAACLDDWQALVAGVEDHLCTTSELSTW